MITPNAALSISRQCMLLGIARSSFYYQPQPSSSAELDLLNRVDRIFTEHPVYGSRRLQVALLREGIPVGRRRVRRLMRKLGLAAVRPKRNTSKPHPEHKIYPYLLRDRAIDQPNQVWSADITYIPMHRGFLYLVAIIDWATRRVLSWRLSNTLTAGFCVEALDEALTKFGRPGVFNTDQGSQFTSEAFTRVLLDHRIEISMDGRGRCHGRVEVWRGCCRLNISVAAPFVRRCLTGPTLAPSPHPARQTGHADFPHPAFSRPVRPSLSAGRRVAVERCRGRVSRRDTRLGSGGTQRLVAPRGASTSGGPVAPCMPERAHRFL